MARKEIINWDESLKTLTESNIINIKKVKDYPIYLSEFKMKHILISAIKQVDHTIEDIKWLSEYNRVVDWLIKPSKKGLHLTGNSGVLKTVITTLVIPLIYLKFHKILIRPINADEIHDKLLSYSNHPVIVVDDIGTEPMASDYGIKTEPFNKLVDMCEKKSKILIITSNLTSQEYIARYGTRVIDRMDALTTTIKFNHKSLR